MLDEDDRIGTSQIETETADAGSQEQAVDGWIGVETIDDILTLLGLDTTVKTGECDRW